MSAAPTLTELHVRRAIGLLIVITTAAPKRARKDSAHRDAYIPWAMIIEGRELLESMGYNFDELWAKYNPREAYKRARAEQEGNGNG